MIWETRKGEDRDKNMKLGVWPGLGNHDYHNNLRPGAFEIRANGSGTPARKPRSRRRVL